MPRCSIPSRVCWRCKQEKPLSDFHKNKLKKDGHDYECKDCKNKYGRNHYQKNRKRILERIELYRLSHIEEISSRTKDWRNKIYKKLAELIGNKCFFCGKEKNLKFHEINGKKHPTDCTYILRHYKDFARVCEKCHKGVHFCMEQLGLSWVKIINV